jgi:Predicted membrane protein involved in D-alanine export
MLFTSLIFIVCFLPAVLIIYYGVLRKHRKLQNIFLLLASLGFYAWGEPKYVLLLLLSITANWIFGLAVARHREDQSRSKMIIFFMVLFNLSILYIFKYLMFTVDNLNRFLGTGFTVSKIMLPIGISFFTFHAISYVIDIYRGKAAVQKNLFHVGLYIVFFPQLVAGPILRYSVIADQIMGRKETFEDFSLGVCRFLIGFGKKILLANNFALVADAAFVLHSDQLSVSFAWLGAIAYTLQIYFDFSGYSDMAIGLGRMFGFHFPENFNYPYISKSTSEFWRRWHISLGTWFRDYVYFPLGGSRVESRGRLIFNLFVVWSLTGLWHGANWTFICWGLLYFVSISLEKSLNFDSLGHGKAAAAAKHAYTMLLVVFGWVLFRSATIAGAASYLKTMLFINGAQLVDANTLVYLAENKVFLLFGILFSMPVYKVLADWFEQKGRPGNPVLAGAMTVVFPSVLLIIFFAAMAYIVKGSYNPFIYFNF